MSDPELVLDEEMPIIDPHVHLWPTGDEHPLARSHSLPELASDVRAGHRVLGTVYVECSSNYRKFGSDELRPPGEVEWLRGLVDESGLWVRDPWDRWLRGRHTGPVHRQSRQSPGRLCKGWRGVLQGHPLRSRLGRKSAAPQFRSFPKPGLLLADSTVQGLRELASRGLSFDTWVYFHQLDELCEQAGTCPDTRVVLDRLGGPAAAGPYASQRDAVPHEWRRGLARLASYDNVVLKLGGMGFQPFVERRAGLVRRLVSDDRGLLATGPAVLHRRVWPDRCMFESNFPVDSALCDYTTLWNVFKRVTVALTPSERAALFHGTATEVYRLGQLSDDRPPRIPGGGTGA